MNLRMKLNLKVTATVQIVDNKTAIFSDEITPSYAKSLYIIKASSKDELWTKIKDAATAAAEPTRFDPIILVTNAQDEYTLTNLAKAKTAAQAPPKETDEPSF